MTNINTVDYKLNDRVYLTHKKFNKLLYGYIIGINLIERIITIELDSGKLFKTNSTGYNKTFFLNKSDAVNKLKEN